MRKSGSSPSPSIGSKNPYSYRYLGKNPGSYVCLLEGTIVGGELVALEPSLSSGIFPGKKTDGPDGILFSKYFDSL